MKKKIIELFDSIKISFTASPILCVLKIIISLIFTFSGLAYSKILSNIISQFEFDNAVFKQLIVLVVLLIIVFIFKNLLKPIDRYINNRYSENIMFFLEKKIIKKMKNIDQKYYEVSSLTDKIRLIRSKYDYFANVGWNVLNLISNIISMVIILLIIMKVNIYIFIFSFFILPMLFVFSNYIITRKNEYENDCQKLSKELSYYKSIIENKTTNYETRLFDDKEFFYEKIEILEEELNKKKIGFENKQDASENIIKFLGVLIYIFSIIVFIKQYKSGIITIALISYYLGIVNNMQEKYDSLFYGICDFLYDINNVSVINDFFNEKTLYELNGFLILNELNPKIEFKNVWFKYPNTDDYVLKDCSFIIEPGEKVALLGKNGSGKSTIIKLLLCFYRIEKGIILINDKNIYDYDLSALRKRMSILFQNYISYSLPFREIISMSNYNEVDNDELIIQSCIKSGIIDLVKTWEKGIDTVIGIYYEDGIGMSGGQWQLTSLARTYFACNKYYILDEPSASLDIYTEDKIFRNIYNEKGVINAITISHMIANSVMADKILIINDGRISEKGNHNELMKKDGLYKKWYMSQYERYIIKDND